MSSSRQERTSAEKWVLLAVALGTMLAPLSSTMIAVALPRIQDEFSTSVAETTWLVTIYLVAMAVVQPIGGRLGDLYGRRTVYLVGLVWFGVASAACAFAPNLTVLTLFRTQQGIAGALSFPNGAAMIREAVPHERRGAAFGLIGLATGVAAATGPPLGGLLVHQFGWEAIFWANLPIVLLALMTGFSHLPKRPGLGKLSSQRFDIVGSGLLALALASFVAIPAAVRLDRQVQAVGALVVAGLAGYSFCRWEGKHSAPVVDLSLFRMRQFAAACTSVGLNNLVMYTTLLALPLYLVRVRGHDEWTVGLTLAALSAIAAVSGPVGGRITDRHGRWLPAVFGACAFASGAMLLAFVVSGDELWPIAVALAAMGLGLGVASAPVQTAAIEAAPMAKTGSAAGVFSTSRYLGSVVGSTLMALVLARSADAADLDRYQLLFAGLAVIAVACIFVNAQLKSDLRPRIID